jgi:hypothetical protein
MNSHDPMEQAIRLIKDMPARQAERDRMVAQATVDAFRLPERDAAVSKATVEALQKAGWRGPDATTGHLEIEDV